MTESRIAPADADQRHQAEGEQRPADRAEVVHGALEPVGPAVARRDDVGQQRVTGRDPQPAGRPRARAQDATCQTDVAAPITDESTAVAV